jgi:hypothetical protein
MNMKMDMDTEMDTYIYKDIERSGCLISDIGKIFNPISNPVSGSGLFSPISKVPIPDSVLYYSSRITIEHPPRPIQLKMEHLDNY